ncbi:MAG: hypothetical protein IJ744_02565 [Lachnospiraceae bacterium]|nr:hypothetical protein [Lachnospiraceae bacterium]
MIQLARLFDHGMTLQRQKPIRIWGSTDCPQEVTVSLNGTILVEKIPIAGGFSIELPAQEAVTDAVLTISGTEDVVELTGVDIGEVWVAGGQSNMEFLLRYDAEGEEQIRNANDPHLRFYDVGEYTFEGEKSQTNKDNCEAWDRWMTFAPDTAEYFSAVGLYFAKVLRTAYDVPIAIIGCNWGGTTASAWTNESDLEEDPALHVYLDEYRAATKDLDREEYEKKHAEALTFLDSEEMKRAMRSVMYGNVSLWEIIKAIPLLGKIVKSGGMPVGPYNQNAPGVLYHNMLCQIAGVAVRGVIWYQGESDDQKAEVYDKLFSAMIRCWRNAWKEELPFLFVQLAPFGKWLGSTGNKYPIVRQRQEKVSKSVPGAYMVSIMDVGDPKDIHPKKKRPVGERLALLARGKVYGEEILCEAPEVCGGEVQDGRLVLRFLHAGEGLKICGKKLDAISVTAEGKRVKSFQASATGDCLVIISNAIRKDTEIEVAFAWEGYCEVNLYNSAGLPVKPFLWKN